MVKLRSLLTLLFIIIVSLHQAFYRIKLDPTSLLPSFTSNATTTTQLHVTTSTTRSNNNLTGSNDFLFEENYFYRLWMGNEFSHAKDFPVYQVYEKWLKHHSQEALHADWQSCFKEDSCDALQNRSFLVATYSCPYESGNRWHRFMNGILWAIATNRTLLARYHTYDVCMEYQDFTPEGCHSKYPPSSKPRDCIDTGLHLSPWIPLYEEWNDRIRNSTKNTKNHKNNDIILMDPLNRQLHPFDEHSKNITMLRVGNLKKPDKMMNRPVLVNKSKLVSDPSVLKRLHHLASHRGYFFYGMVLESVLTLDPSLNPPTTQKEDDEFSFFLHSRHGTGLADNYTWPEKKCIERIMNETFCKLPNNNSSSCRWYVMSDREVTLQLLSNYILNKTSCQLETLSSSRQASKQNPSFQNDTSFRDEHGLFAGRGYWEDLALCRQARRGMVSFHQTRRKYARTSTSMVREFIEFRRQLENVQKTPKFVSCEGYKGLFFD